ncbi:MAG: hypothetical protein PHE79_09730 [Eubacteriales bacterium]|nr:hypothetical protein [Eubacteriales bacterium]
MLSQLIYADLSGGLNDSIAAISIKDSELAFSECADYSAEVKGIQTSKGCTKINEASYAADITDGYRWTIGSTYKRCLVKGGKVYDVDINDGTLTEKITLTVNAKRIYPFVMYERLYFGDGSELYVWGDFNFASDLGTVTISTGKVVKNNHSATGTIGNFYKAKSDFGSIDLKTQDYTDTVKWEDVTDVRYFSSNVVAKVVAHDPSKKEIVLLTITKGAAAAGTVSIILNDVTFTCAIASTDTVPEIIDKIMAVTTTGWTKTKVSNSVRFTKDAAGLSVNGYFDPSVTGISATYEVTQEGKDNDNDLTPIKKCTMFVVHPGSYRVFAAGNPDDNGLYYGEIGNPAYFASAINKVYPANGYGKITAIGVLSDSIIVSYENGWYAWDGITPLKDARWGPLNLPYGCVCHESLALTPYSFTYLGKDGLYTVSASILSSDLVLIQGKDIIKKITENRVEKTMGSIKDRKMCRGVFYDNVYYLAYNTDGEKNDKVLKYEWDTKSFTIKTGWIVNQWLPDPEELYFASKNFLLKANDGYSDIDVDTGEKRPIQFHVKTKDYALGNILSTKNLRFMGLVFKQNSEPKSSIDINVIMGYEEYHVDEVDLAESLVYGRDWGAIWGFSESVIKMVEVSRASNAFQIELINNNLDDPVTLIGIGFIFEESDLVLPNIMKDEVLLT